MNVNRRLFTFGLGTLAAAPAVPAGALTKTAGSNAMRGHYKTAQIIARAHNKCSKQFLMRHLRIDAGMAGQLERLLLERGVITLPGANGVAQAVNPIQPKLPQDTMGQAVNQVKSLRGRLNDRLKSAKDLVADKRSDPDHTQEQADDTIPASHADAE